MANDDQKAFWTEQGGPKWLEFEARLDEAARPFGVAALEAADVRQGTRAIDIGCGTGPTSIDLAKRVGPDGRVLGADISPLLLGRARERAKEEGLGNVEFIEADAQTHDFEPGSADLLFSRFGVMFFEDSVAAFANMRRALDSGGRLAFVCWQDAASNVWMSTPVMAMATVLGPPDPPPPDAPGPFRFADADLIRQILTDAGYKDIDVQDLHTTMDSPVERVQIAAQMGPLGSKFAEADDATKQRAIDAIMEAAEPFKSGDNYALPAAVWIVTAGA